MAKTARQIALEFLPLDDEVTAELVDEIEAIQKRVVRDAHAELISAMRNVLDDWTE